MNLFEEKDAKGIGTHKVGLKGTVRCRLGLNRRPCVLFSRG